MNAILFSAIWGIVMMFGGAYMRSRTMLRFLAILGVLGLLLVNIFDMLGYHLAIDSHSMLYFDSFGLLFNCIAFTSTLLYFLLSGKDIENVGAIAGEYYALVFFVLC